MQKNSMIIALMAGGLALATMNLTARGADEMLPPSGHPQSAQSGYHSKEATPTQSPYGTLDFKASSIVGLAVLNDTGERLGKVQDLIISLTSGSVPFAIVEYGGTLGLGQTRVAVPLKDLKYSSEPKQLILATTKAQFQSASSAPTGGWIAVADEDWMRNIDRFYGQPSASSSRFERQETSGVTEGREPVRDPAEQRGASHLLDQPGTVNPVLDNMLSKPAGEDLSTKVNGLVRQNLADKASDIQVALTNGIVTLSGKVPNEAQKTALENQIKALPGVNQVENHLVTGSD
jgi:sporulation protein YlmC with PRC-barrel domain